MENNCQRGLFITIEGTEGAGKSSIVRVLRERIFCKRNDFLFTREPGSTEIAEEIRRIVLTPFSEKMHKDTEILLYFAARAQHLHAKIYPALEQGINVICDRFTDSTYAYQSAGHDVSFEKTAILERFVQNDFRPDLTIILDVSPKIGFERVKKRHHDLDRIEMEHISFFEKVRDCYLTLAKQNKERYRVVDASKSFSFVLSSVIKLIEEKMAKRNETT